MIGNRQPTRPKGDALHSVADRVGEECVKNHDRILGHGAVREDEASSEGLKSFFELEKMKKRFTDSEI